MKFLSKLWFGEHSLFKTYWLCCVFIPLLLSIPIKLWSLRIDPNFLTLFFYLYLVSTYSFIAIIGLWRSSDYYNGNKIWFWFAKLTVIIGLISQIFLIIQTILQGISYPIWYLLLVSTTLFVFHKLVQKKELNSSADVVIKDGITKESVDENILWEQVASEFELNRNEGLWTRLFVENNGDENKAKVKYLAFRFNELKVSVKSKPSPSYSYTYTGSILFIFFSLLFVFLIWIILGNIPMKYY
jgi:hypothetical protein